MYFSKVTKLANVFDICMLSITFLLTKTKHLIQFDTSLRTFYIADPESVLIACHVLHSCKYQLPIGYTIYVAKIVTTILSMKIEVHSILMKVFFFSNTECAHNIRSRRNNQIQMSLLA